MTPISELFFQCVEKSPDKIAVIDNSEVITYTDLAREILLIEHFIESLEIVNYGRPIGFYGTTSIESISLIFAVAKLNLSVTPINVELSTFQIMELLRQLSIDVVILDIRSTAANSMVDSGFMLAKFKFFSVIKISKNSPIEVILPEEAFLITTSSGSTGTPKPIIYSQQTKVDRWLQSKSLYSVNEEDKVLCATPLYHSLGLRLVFLPLLTGATLVNVDGFTKEKWIEATINEEVTFTIAVSTHLNFLKQELLKKNSSIKSLRALVSSSAGLKFELKKELFDSKNFKFYEQYGASEVATVSNCSKEVYLNYPESVGELCPGVDVYIENLKGETEVGEIIVESKLTCLGTITGGAFVRLRGMPFKTSDLGYKLNNILYFRGRSQDVIKVGGQNVFFKDIQQAFLKNPKVIAVEVIEVENSLLGSGLTVFIESNDKSLSKRDLWDYSKKHLAKFQQPIEIEILSKLPLFANGKVDKSLLRKWK